MQVPAYAGRKTESTSHDRCLQTNKRDMKSIVSDGKKAAEMMNVINR